MINRARAVSLSASALGRQRYSENAWDLDVRFAWRAREIRACIALF
jgi:hypothetical protein